MQEIYYWKRQLKLIREDLRKVWQHCPKCGAALDFEGLAWDAESDRHFLFIECANESPSHRHLFRVDEEFFLYSIEGDEVFAPKEVVCDAN